VVEGALRSGIACSLGTLEIVVRVDAADRERGPDQIDESGVQYRFSEEKRT
jgi:hypothetical protein